MIVYSSNKQQFINDVRSNSLTERIKNEIARRMNRNLPAGEHRAWENSMQFMMNVLLDNDIPGTAGVAIEYNIPLTNRRVDFILTGKNPDKQETAIIVELKQWSEVEKTPKDAIVRTWLGGAKRETNHPSYQAWSYAALIEDYNETVRSENVLMIPCAYLHNMKSKREIDDPFYSEHTKRAPVFVSEDVERLANFIKSNVRYGDSLNQIMYRIEHGVIKPSKSLADALDSMMQGNTEFYLIDEQKLAFETAIDLAHRTESEGKKCLIIEGGPGTGKSVLAINLLVEFTRREMIAQYVSKNSAPREVYKVKLKGTHKKTHIDNLFKGSGNYIDTPVDTYRALIVDEAQRVTLNDVGTIDEIREKAAELGVEVHQLKLDSQFRCNGSDGYLAWVDHALQIRTTANSDLAGIDYEFRVFDSPKELHEAIRDKNSVANKSRLVAGYCWDWASKKDPTQSDIQIEEFDYNAQWNLGNDGMLWAIAPQSVEQVGCIHTCQGLEFDYVGVIIGDDLRVVDGRVATDGSKRSSQDRSIRGFKSMLKKDKEYALAQADQIIKNTYRTLMTRGQKGCYLFATDKETRDYFRQFVVEAEALEVQSELTRSLEDLRAQGVLIFPREQIRDYPNPVPVYSLEAAAGEFSEFQLPEAEYWAALPDTFKVDSNYFIFRVVGESMNRKIPNGSWCLFRANPGGSRNGKIVLVQHRSISDPDYGGNFTVKIYQSDKIEEYGEVLNQRIILKPHTTAYGFREIHIDEDLEDVRVVAEFIAVL